MSGSFLKAAGGALAFMGISLLALQGGPALAAGNISSFLSIAFAATGAMGLGYTAYKGPDWAAAPA